MLPVLLLLRKSLSDCSALDQMNKIIQLLMQFKRKKLFVSQYCKTEPQRLETRFKFFGVTDEYLRTYSTMARLLKGQNWKVVKLRKRNANTKMKNYSEKKEIMNLPKGSTSRNSRISFPLSTTAINAKMMGVAFYASSYTSLKFVPRM